MYAWVAGSSSVGAVQLLSRYSAGRVSAAAKPAGALLRSRPDNAVKDADAALDEVRRDRTFLGIPAASQQRVLAEVGNRPTEGVHGQGVALLNRRCRMRRCSSVIEIGTLLEATTR